MIAEALLQVLTKFYLSLYSAICPFLEPGLSAGFGAGGNPSRSEAEVGAPSEAARSVQHVSVPIKQGGR